MTNRDKAIAIITALGTGDTAPVEKYISDETYIQHNPGAPSGKAAFLGMFGMLGDDAASKVVRAFEDGDYVALHTDYFLAPFGGPLVGFDVFRFENGLVVEHWDNLIAKADPNPSGHTQLDGATEITDLDKTEANRETIRNFLQDILVDGKQNFTDYISTETYIQHNPQVADGLAGFGEFAATIAAQGIAMAYTTVHNIIAEGNFVLSMSEGTFGDQHTAYYDLFRLENGLIVEHWDVIAAIPPADQAANDNGKF